jgi:lipopolysaccharide export system protein LptA
LALGSVKIKSDDDSISGQGAEARFVPVKGDLELFQNARLRVGQSEVRGEKILVNISNQVVKSTESSFLRLPTSSISSTTATAGSSNLFLEILSDSFSYSPAQAEFIGRVKAHYLSETNVLSTLDAGYLKLNFGTNQSLDQMFARDSAIFRQYPSTGSVSNDFEREIKAQSVLFKFFPGGREMHSFVADEDVFFRQRNTAAANPSLMQVECGHIYSEFSRSNQLSRALADGSVRLVQNLDVFRGDKAVFSSETNQSMLVLSGKPFALLNRVDNKGRTNVVEILDSDVFIWYPDRNTFKARGPWRLVQPNSSFGKN